MKDGKIKVVVAAVSRRRIYMVPLFLGAVTIGFLLELSTYESLNFAQIKLAIANLPQRWNRKDPIQSPSFGEDSGESGETDENGGLEEQSENETVVFEKLPPLWEQPILLNLNPSTWVMVNESLCQLGQDQTPENTRIMPVLVHTARSHFDERLALRKSWGSVPIYKLWDVRFVFLLGEADRGLNPQVSEEQYQEEEKRLNAEQQIFGDIVIGNFIDSYHNLTYKHMMGYKWVLNFCQSATFVLKVDDDMFIDILRWLDWRSADLDKIAGNSSAVIPELYCHTFGGTQPLRETGNKWYASKQDWPEEFYPDYCSGWGYGISVELIKKLYSVSLNAKFFWIDDVFATGVLLEIVKKRYTWKPEIMHIWGNVTGDIAEYRPLCESGSLEDKRLFRAVVYVPRGDLFERDMMCMWNKTLYDSPYEFTL